MCCVGAPILLALVGLGLTLRALRRGASSSTQTSSGGSAGGSPEPAKEPV